jgi:hypothetical protein
MMQLRVLDLFCGGMACRWIRRRWIRSYGSRYRPARVVPLSVHLGQRPGFLEDRDFVSSSISYTLIRLAKRTRERSIFVMRKAEADMVTC